MIVVQVMQVADIPEALALWNNCEGIVLRDIDAPECLKRYLERNAQMSFIARNRSGMLLGALLAGHDGRRGFLHHVAVHPNHRRRGIAKTLVERALQALADDGILKCHLLVDKVNESGRSFWEHMGWQLRDTLDLMSFNMSDNPNI